ncbi:hypothetical protein Sjap_000919 [Stephania japonica]|uniref:F-box domain-containing protein n=1 Tax=Stephania japonica TaxID=461633 RepID=A0AAP0KKS6_9MAGN
MEIMVVQYKSCKCFLHYKLLRVSKPQGPSEKKIQYCFELFDSAASDSSWKEVGCVKLPCGQIHRGQAILVDAMFHWLFKTLENNYMFLAFNMEIDESLGRHNMDRYNMPKRSMRMPFMLALEEKQNQQSRELPTDLIFEQILSRLPIDNLYPLCRSVCKEWQDFLWGRHFIHLNNERIEHDFYLSYQKLCSCHNNGSPYTLKVIGYDYPPSTPSIPCPYFPTTDDEYDYYSYIIYSTSTFNTYAGIYCLSDDPDFVLNPRYFICKSDTRQDMQLPEPDHTSQTVAMKIMVVQYKSSAGLLHYKVLRVSKPQGPSEKKIQYCFELFDSAAGDSSWKEIDCVKLPCGQIHRGKLF